MSTFLETVLQLLIEPRKWPYKFPNFTPPICFDPDLKVLTQSMFSSVIQLHSSSAEFASQSTFYSAAFSDADVIA